MKTTRSARLFNEAQELLPGGVNSPVRAFRSVGGTPLFMKRGVGAHIIDEDDNEFIDYCMSWGPLILGHAYPAVVDAIRETAGQGTSFGTPNSREVAIARAVIDRFPSIEMCRFVSSGTEATMSAIRLARGFTGRPKIIKFDGCYHGHADHLLVAAGSGLATFGTPDSAGVTADNARDTLVVPFNDLAQVERTISQFPDAIAAIIVEPLPCNYGMIPPMPGFLAGLRALCDEHQILLIFDEVITGFRLARGGAQEYYGVPADITTLGKIIGGGMPVGAYGASREIMGKIAPEGPVYQAGTLSGNPLAMAAGLATLEAIDGLSAYDLLAQKAARLKELATPVLERYRGRVLMLQAESIFAIYFTDRSEITTVDQVRACNMQLFALFHREMLNRGIYLSPSGYEVGFLSTAHNDEDIERTVQALDESLDALF